MDKHGKLEKLSHEIFCLEEAIEYLGQVPGNEDVIEVLQDRMIVLGFARDALHRLIEADDARDDEALRREYERDLI